MRWVKPEHGAIKTKTWFAWWPVRVGREVRWMEWVTAEMEFVEPYAARSHWLVTRFITTPKPEPKPQPTVAQDNHTRKVELDDE